MYTIPDYAGAELWQLGVAYGDTGAAGEPLIAWPSPVVIAGTPPAVVDSAQIILNAGIQNYDASADGDPGQALINAWVRAVKANGGRVTRMPAGTSDVGELCSVYYGPGTANASYAVRPIPLALYILAPDYILVLDHGQDNLVQEAIAANAPNVPEDPNNPSAGQQLVDGLKWFAIGAVALVALVAWHEVK